MGNSVSLGIYVPSYKRYDRILTQDLLERCTYVVRKSEEDLYRQAGVKDILAVEDNLIDSNIKVYRWIIENAPEDIVFVADDDIEDVMYRLDKNTPLNKDKETIMAEIERIAQILYDLRLGYACIDATGVPYGYCSEFAFKGTSGSMKWVNKSCFKAKIDDSVKFTYDIDIIMQELLHNRIVIKPSYIVGKDKQDTNKGGDSGKLRQDQIDSIETMKIKWGRHYGYDYKTNKPRIKVPR